MNYALHPLAKNDVIDAQDYYEQQAGHQVALRFTEELTRVIQLLRQNPGFGTPIAQQRRIYPLKSFPYALVYQVHDDHLYILILRHHRQKPNYASSRH
jgi:plasmid stabilization system protein ParE